MIHLHRVRTSGAIASAFRGATPRNRLVSLMKDVRSQLQAGVPLDQVKPEIDSKWSSVKDQLLKESNDKCAYCESSMLAVAFGDVEHYRPKSVYWWLAYVYDNYLASCAICNQRFKGAQFAYGAAGTIMPPPAGLTGQSSDAELDTLARTSIPDPLDAVAVANFIAAHRAEEPLIPNPYFDEPESLFAWDVVEGIGEVSVVPRPGVPEAPAILAACEQIYGINRTDLRRRRFNIYRFYKGFKDALAALPAGSPARNNIEAIIASMTEDESEYAAMIRFLEAQAVQP